VNNDDKTIYGFVQIDFHNKKNMTSLAATMVCWYEEGSEPRAAAYDNK
jgi:hypothetical protein